MVPRRGLEPPRPCERQHLKLVRLPIPPPGHRVVFSAGGRVRGGPGPCQTGLAGRFPGLIFEQVTRLALQPLANRLERGEADSFDLA